MSFVAKATRSATFATTSASGPPGSSGQIVTLSLSVDIAAEASVRIVPSSSDWRSTATLLRKWSTSIGCGWRTTIGFPVVVAALCSSSRSFYASSAIIARTT